MIPSLLFIFLAISVFFPSAIHPWSTVILQSMVFVCLAIMITPTADKFKPTKSAAITATFLIYILLSLISFFVAYYRNASWHGWFILLIGFIIYWLYKKQPITKPIFSRYTGQDIIGIGLIILGVIQAGLGIYQYVYGFNYTIRLMTQNPELVNSQYYSGILHALQTHRIIGSFGNPNVYAVFLAMILPISIFYLLQEKQIFLKILYLISSAIIITALIFTYSRGGIICTSCGLIPLILICKKLFKIQSLYWIIGIILLAMLLFAISSKIAKSDIQSEKSESISARIYTPSSTVNERLHYWSMAKQMIIDHPVIGTGIGSFGIRYGKYKPVGIGESKYVHNLFLQVWVEQGMLGLIGLLGLIIALFYSAITRYRHLATHPEYGFSLAIFGGIIAFIIDGFFGYGYYVPELYYLFCFLIGIFIASGVKEPEPIIPVSIPTTESEVAPEPIPEPIRPKLSFSRLVSLSIIVLILAIVWYFAIFISYLGQIYFNAALVQLQTDNLIPAAAGYKAAVVCEPSNSEYHQHLGNTLLQLKQTEQGITELEITVHLNPYTAYYRSDLAAAYLQVGRFIDAEQQCRAAIANYPTKPGYHYQLAQIYSTQGKEELATQEMQKFTELTP
ncbi:MAG: O-antigen ligase family protein [bacterium]